MSVPTAYNNSRSEVTSAKKKLSASEFIGGSQFEFEFDDIGNRAVAKSGGNSTGAGLAISTYAPANALNQLTTRTVPPVIGVSGATPGTLTLQGSVNGQPFSLSRQGAEYFSGQAVVDNSAVPVWADVNVQAREGATLKGIVSGRRYVAKTPETFAYDDDGNLLRDGRFDYSWDAENRLITVETRVEAAAAGVPIERIGFGYDADNRRYRKEVSVFDSVANDYGLPVKTLFVYDGWNLVGELADDLQPQRVYQWGLDLSGTQQGAGGVGGLLSMEDVRQNRAYYYSFDGNGNVTALVASTGAIAAHYEYGPFGEPLRATGVIAESNPFRFSTKYQDEETGLLYYGFRYLKDGRWLSRDPIEEEGGLNLYGYVRNDPVNGWDPLGLLDFSNLTPSPLSGLYDKETKTTYRRLDGAYTDKGNPVAVYEAINPKSELYKTNCHGTTFTGGKYWLQSDAAKQILADEYKRVPLSGLKIGDVAAYLDALFPVHTGTVSRITPAGEVLINDKSGSTAPRTNFPASNAHGGAYPDSGLGPIPRFYTPFK